MLEIGERTVERVDGRREQEGRQLQTRAREEAGTRYGLLLPAHSAGAGDGA